jgi:hypothetical protein
VFAALCTLLGAQAVRDDALLGLLMAAIVRCDVEAVQQLCKLEGAAEIDADGEMAGTLQCLLNWVLTVDSSKAARDAVLRVLCGLPAAKKLKAVDVVDLTCALLEMDELCGWQQQQQRGGGVYEEGGGCGEGEHEREPTESLLARVVWGGN